MTAVTLAEPVCRAPQGAILMTSSPHENESLTALKKFTEGLKANGLSLHDVAAGALDPPVPTVRSEPHRHLQHRNQRCGEPHVEGRWEIDCGELARLDLAKFVASTPAPAD